MFFVKEIYSNQQTFERAAIMNTFSLLIIILSLSKWSSGRISFNTCSGASF